MTITFKIIHLLYFIYLYKHLYDIFKQFIIIEIAWGLGIGDWGLGIGDWGLGPIPNPQSPIPNPQSKNYIIKLIIIINKILKLIIFLK